MNLAERLSVEIAQKLRESQDEYAPRYDFEQEPVFKRWDSEENVFKFHPLHPGQKDVWGALEREVAAIAGTRSGKTCLGPYLVARELQRKGGGNAIIVGPTYPLMDRHLIPECVKVWKHEFDMGEYRPGRRCFEFSKKGCSILGVREAFAWFGFAEDPESLESMEAVCAWLDEAGQSKFSRESKEAIDRRLSIAQGRKFYTTTPYQFNWFKSDIHDRFYSEPNSGIRVVRYLSKDNPLFPIEEWNRQEAILPKWKFDMMYRGMFTRPAGAVFENFDDNSETGHVIPGFKCPSDWVVYQGVDFGEANTASLWIARQPQTEKYIVFSEYHAGKIPVDEHTRSWGLRPDPEASCGGAPSEDEWRREFTENGWFIRRPPIKDRALGYQLVNSFFKTNTLYVSDSCPKLIEQLKTMNYELHPETGEVNPARIENEKDYHLIAALRYAISMIDGGTGEAIIKEGQYLPAPNEPDESDAWCPVRNYMPAAYG